MRLPARLRLPVGRRPRRALLVVVVALAGAAAAVGMGSGSSSQPAAAGPSRPAVPAPAAGARPFVSGMDARKRVAEHRGRRPGRGGAAHYRRTARKHVPAKAAAGFLPLYREAERRFGVNWRLIASIHRQETAFSTDPSTYRGLNAFGCCAGPMQFNVTNGPVSTWDSYRQAFRAGRRPERYPHRTRSHPSVYDDFDAIMAAGSLLSDSGAGRSLDSGAWSAAYAYYGHDLFGVTYASQVLARAEAWQLDGFCPNCGLDEGLVAEFDDAYGEPVRRQLLDAERRRKQKKRKQEGDRKGDRRDRHGRRKGDGGSDDRARHRSRARRPARRPSAKNERPKPSPRPRRRRSGPTNPEPAPPTTTQPSATPPTTPPPADECPSIRKLLGCRP